MIPFLSIALLSLLILSISVGIVLFLLGLSIDALFTAFPLNKALGRMIWSSSNSATLIAIPFFVLLGEILVRSGVAARTYEALDRLISWLPGGLVHANIATATMFSATSGSSVATAATVSTVAMPQARRLGYDEKLFSGAIAAGGTLGIMIPPSINLIVYGFLTQSSIPQLFLAGLIPGLLLALGFILVTALICTLKPELGGPSREFSFRERVSAIGDLSPIVGLFLMIVGSIYTGFATPTEAAAVGVLGAIIISALFGSLSIRALHEAMTGTIKITAMIMLIILGASFLNFTLASAGLANELDDFLAGLGLGRMELLFVIVLLYIVLGMFIETLSLMVVTIPIIVPIILQLDFDVIWFGILMIVLVEMALITPPVGLNLYVVQSARDRGTITDVMIGSLPYVMVMIVMLILLIVFPEIATWLPNSLESR